MRRSVSGHCTRPSTLVLSVMIFRVCVGQSSDCQPEWLPSFGGEKGADAAVQCLTVFDDGLGSGPALIVGGDFLSIGGVPANKVAKWNGSNWSPLGSGMNAQVSCLAVFDDGMGGGPALYAGGHFSTAGGKPISRVAKWDGKEWSPVGTGTANSGVWALAVFDDGRSGGPALYATGSFTMIGGISANRIAKWDGKEWSPLGSGLNSWAYALAVFDDGLGGGPALYAGGSFWIAGGVSALKIAKWNGESWSALGGFSTNTLYMLQVFDDGSGNGPALYAGGTFLTIGGVAANFVAKWNGTVWSPLGRGANNWISGLAVYDDGTGGGPALFACGGFTSAGSVPANRIAKWDGTEWSALGSGTNGPTFRMAIFDDGSGDGPSLYAGGEFTLAGGEAEHYIARWQGCPSNQLPEDLNGDGQVDGDDLGTLLGQWGACSGCPADFNGDGQVDGDDLGTLLGAWGPVP